MNAFKPARSVLDPELIAAWTEALPACAPAPEARARIWSTLQQRLVAAASSEHPGSRFVHQHQGTWHAVLPGVELKLLRDEGLERSYLLRLAPGASIPPHHHPVDEESFVLEGEITIEGVVCRAGDYHFAPRGGMHRAVTSATGGVMLVRGAFDPSQLLEPL
jgi:quercetin dioxygenase-like cupin family protein